jgi:anthranilate synthase component II
MILLVDNYDSFVHNLARYFQRLGQRTLVLRNDEVTMRELNRIEPQAIVFSPGPCTPTEAGQSVEVVREFYKRIPLLGVCLGHQVIAAAFGAQIIRAAEPMHGRTSLISHEGRGLFDRVPSPLTVCRYHSLVVDEGTLPVEFAVTARTTDGTIMAIEHAELPLFGVQFHPEATLTEYGHQLLKNFLLCAEIAVDCDAEEVAETEFRYAAVNDIVLPTKPVTF